MKKLLLFTLLALAVQQSMAQVARKSLVEDLTGTWCGFCPYNMTYIEQAKTDYPGQIIDVTIHGPNPASDTMSNEFAYFITDFYTAQNGNTSYSYPSAMVDRIKWNTSSQTPQFISGVTAHNFIEDYASDDIYTSPVGIDINSSYNSTTRYTSVTVTANFVNSVSGDIRFNCYLVEDSVIGPSAGAPPWSQENYASHSAPSCWSDGSTTKNPASAWYNYPCVMQTATTGQFVFTHRNVVRYSMSFPYTDWSVQPDFNSLWGSTGIPASVTAGQHFSKTYNYTLPQEWNSNHMKAVAFISYFDTTDSLGGEVLNVEEVALGQSVTGIPENPAAIDQVSLDAAYPNPMSEFTHVKVNVPASQHISVKVYDLLGHQVATLVSENLAPGEHTFYWNGKNQDGASLSNGVYLIRLQTDRQSLAKSIVIARN